MHRRLPVGSASGIGECMTGSPKQSALYSITIHAGVIAVILLTTAGKTPLGPILPASFADLKVYLPHARGSSPGGGGGGMRESTPPSRGSLPKPATRKFMAPAVRLINLDPKLAMEQTLLVNMPMPVIASPQIGDPNGLIGPPSAGPGDGIGIGNGRGRSIGPGDKDGYGPGPGGPGLGDSDMNGRGGSRGSFTAPVAIYKPEPPYTEDARRAKLQGTVVLLIDIDAHGQAQNIRVLRSLGLGLDERAMETVKTWRFKPAYSDGKPVTATATIEVNFRLL